MNARIHVALPFVGFGSSLTAFALLTFHAGWILRGFEDQSIGLALAIMAGVPIASVFIVLARERSTRFLLLVMLIAFEASAYLVLFNFPNAVMNVGYWPDPFSTTTISLLLGCILSILMISAGDLVKSTGSTGARMQLLAACVIMPGLSLGFATLVSAQDWFEFILLSMMIVPVAVLCHLAGRWMPGASVTIDHEKRVEVAINSRKDPVKGLKLAMFLVVALVNLVLLIGVDGIALGTSFYVENNWLFYMFTAAGTNFILLAMIGIKALMGNEWRESAARKGDFAWISIIAMQFSMWSIAISCELLVPGYHGSVLAQVIDGFTAGIMIVTTFQVVFMQQSPRHASAFIMSMVFFLGLAMVFGSYLKIVPTNMTELHAVAEYLPYIVGIEFALVMIVVLLLLIPLMVQKHGNQTHDK